MTCRQCWNEISIFNEDTARCKKCKELFCSPECLKKHLDEADEIIEQMINPPEHFYADGDTQWQQERRAEDFKARRAEYEIDSERYDYEPDAEGGLEMERARR